MITKELEIGGKKITVETGELAKLAAGSVVVKSGETAVMANVVADREPLPEEDQWDMVPLLVDYRERTYAIGKIPGGFFKREGRPRERETLTSRMIDRSIRPFFPKGFQHRVQIAIMVLSADGEHDTGMLSLFAASCALMISDVPFNGPVGCVNITNLDGKYEVNPVYSQMTKESMDLTVVCVGEKVIMLELGALSASEDDVMKAIDAAMPEVKKTIRFQEELRKEAGKPKMEFSAGSRQDIENTVKPLVEGKLDGVVGISDKSERAAAYREIVKGVLEDASVKEKYLEKTVKSVVEEFYRVAVRNQILNSSSRIDGRKNDEIRPISCMIGKFPRVHGSAVFTRGQTQSLATVTLGTPSDRQVIEELSGEYKERFLLHYNFPGYATGEVRPERGSSRREIGHGALARKALDLLLPGEDEFPYTVRVVSDILESNGSSSMATVCGGSLALFDAGVPMKSAAAGVAMGLVKEGGKYVVLTDIMGSEDHYGDMDFKVAGTREGITAIQLDVKNDGLETDLVRQTIEQAKSARMNILDKMEEVIREPRAALSSYAPKMVILQVPESRIGELIGPGGKNIRKIVEETGAKIDIEDGGKVYITGENGESVDSATKRVEYYTAEVEIGKIYNGKITRITDFGAFVEILPGKEGLVHVSRWADRRISKVKDVAKEGDEILVKCTDIDNLGRIVLSRKDALKSGDGKPGKK